MLANWPGHYPNSHRVAVAVDSIYGSRLRADALFNRVQWIVFILAALLAAAYLAWLALAQANFLYPLWYNGIGIDRTIEIYTPQNRYQQGFEETSKAERSHLFAAIVDAIHNHGRGLRKLVYHDATGRQLGYLLRNPEVTHLQDVARLIDRIRPVGLGAVIVTAALLFVIRRRKAPMPSLILLSLGAIAPLCAIAMTVISIGPIKVFYWLHTHIFPPDHEWFFYYQNSLMSTMMKAPDLFGYIAATWALLTLFLLLILIGVAWLSTSSQAYDFSPRAP
jgi:hypothetical protein